MTAVVADCTLGPRLKAGGGLLRYVPIAFFALGCACTARYAELNASPGESGQAAIDLLRHGTLGDPYLLPTGPTAHVSPVLGGLLAATYWLLGVNTVGARTALGVLAAALFALGVRAVLRIGILNGVATSTLWLAAAAFALTPSFLFQSVVYDRQWDQPFAACILVNAWLIVDAARYARPRSRSELRLAALAGVGGLFHPRSFRHSSYLSDGFCGETEPAALAPN